MFYYIYTKKYPFIMKKCSLCKKEKNKDEFQFQNKKTNKIMSACKECSRERQRSKRQLNLLKIRENDKVRYQKTKEHRTKYAREYREKYPDKTRATMLKGKYGLTPEQYDEKLNIQGFKCAICEIHIDEYKKHLCVDHNHKTGKIRDLLCMPCNYGLGHYEKQSDLYRKYLDKHNLTLK